MNRLMLFALVGVMTPASVSAQQDPAQNLAEVLPASLAAQVIAHMEEAGARGLPTQAMANVALEGVVKGRSSAEVLAAVEAMGADMGRAQAAFEGTGHTPEPAEIEAATAAMRMGVDGEAIADLARSQPSGPALTVPMMVLGGLTQRGLPSDDALAAVMQRLAGRADDAGLVGDLPGIGRQGMTPGQVGQGLGSAMAGFTVPVSGPAVPMGPPSGRGGGRPSNLPTPPGSPADPAGGPPGG